MTQKMQISDFFGDKYKKFMYLKTFSNLRSRFSIIVSRFSQKRLGSVLFSKDGRVTANIHISFWSNMHYLYVA